MASSVPSPTPDEQEFEQALHEVERSLQQLKDRYAQVKRDQQRQAELQQRYDQIEREYRQFPAPSLKDELTQLQKQIDDLELALESRLFSWEGLKDVFWQAVRFGGLGVIVGWILHAWAG